MAKQDTVYVGATIPANIHKALLELSAEQDKSISAIIRTALAEYLPKVKTKSK